MRAPTGLVLALALAPACFGRTDISTVGGAGDGGDVDAVGGDVTPGDAAGDPGFPEMTHTVNSLADTHDANPGDEVCADTVSECTLRAAIEEANARPGLDFVDVPAGQIQITEGEIPVTDALEVAGRHAELTTLTCDGGSRAFAVTNTMLSLIGLSVVFCSVDGDGGAVWASESVVSVHESSLSFNSATGRGGAIYASGATGRFVVLGAAFTSNSAGVSGGAVDAAVPDVSIAAGVFSGNSAPTAGAVAAVADEVRVAKSTFWSNQATSDSGGALSLESSGPLLVTNNTFKDNNATTDGGALRIGAGAAQLNHNTFDVNVAGGEGGTLAIASGASAVLANNILQRGFGFGGSGQHCFVLGSGTLASLGGNVSDRALADCNLGANDLAGVAEQHLSPSLELRGGPTPTLAPVEGSPAIDGGAADHCLPTDQRNLARGSACDAGAFEVQASVPPCCLSYRRSWVAVGQGVPMTPLTPVAQGGNLSYTISPPLPAGLTLDPDDGTIAGTAVYEWSQHAHTVTASNDSGSTTTQLEVYVMPPLVVTSTDDLGDDNPGDGDCSSASGCTLRAALEENSVVFPHVVLVPSGVFQVTQPLATSHWVVIVGQGSSSTVLDGGGVTRVLDTSQLYVSDLMIQNGNTVSASGGGIRASGPVHASNVSIVNSHADVSGGALAVLAPVWVEFSQLIGNTSSSDGGAIHASGDCTTESTHFEGNSATSGGAIYQGSGMLDAARSLFVDNSATADGGAIYVGGKIWAEGTTWSANVAGGAGGAIVQDSTGVVSSIRGSTFSQNTALSGAAIALVSGGLRLDRSIVASTTSSCSAPLTGGDFNIEFGSTCGLASGSNQINTNPGLSVAGLADNGGPTQTIGLSPGSPAIDAVPVGTCDTWDQTFRERPLDGDGDNVARCDVGAFEVR